MTDYALELIARTAANRIGCIYQHQKHYYTFVYVHVNVYRYGFVCEQLNICYMRLQMLR